MDFKALGERSIVVDCDVIQADGGTRTASITGGFIALYLACKKLLDEGLIEQMPVKCFVSAISVGIINGEPMLDLCYEEDSNADVDMNIIMTDKGDFVELQGTGEGNTFNINELNELIALGVKGNGLLNDIQKEVLL